jgi:hypothetical protein
MGMVRFDAINVHTERKIGLSFSANMATVIWAVIIGPR